MKRRLVIRWHLPVVRDPSAVSGQIRIVSRKYSVANSTFIGIPQDNTSPPLSLIQLESLFSLPTMIVNRNSLLDLHTKSRVIVPNQFENWARCDFRSIKSTISHFRGRWEIPESRPFLFQSKTVALPHVPIGDVESLRGLLQENHPNLSDVYYTTYPSDSDLIKMVLSNEGVTEIVLGSFYAEWTDDEQLSRMLIQDVINHIDIQTLYQDVREALKEEEVLVVIDGSNLAIIELGDVVRVTGPPAIAIEAGPRLRKH